MTRLIDADALMEILVHRSYSVTDYWNNRDAGMFLYGIEQAVNEQPTVDAVPVVRCKDCKWYEFDRKMHCGLPHGVRSKDDYCSDAERKDK